MERGQIVRDSREDHGEDVPREARDVAVRLGRLVEAVEPSPVEDDADAAQQRAIDEHSVLPTGRFRDRPLRDMCHSPG